MVTLTLYPRLNSSAHLTPNTGTNYAAVDDAVADDDTTYVQGAAGQWLEDLYVHDCPCSLGTISSIVVRMRCKGAAGEKARTRMYNQLNDTGYNGSDISLTTSYANYDTTYNTNPRTGVAWTWAELPYVYYGVQLYGATARCTLHQIIVTYTPSAGTITISADQTSRVCYRLTSGQTLHINDYIVFKRSSLNPSDMVIGTDCNITGGGYFEGDFVSSQSNLIDLFGTSSVIGTSSTVPLHIINNLFTGICFNDPTNCLCQDVAVSDCRSGTSTVPVVGDASSGVPILFYGAGSGNTMRRCDIKRGGLHGFQFYQNSDNLVDACSVDGVFGYFGGSFYQSDRSVCQNSTFANTRREGFNLMQCVGSSLTDFAVRNGQTDYGVSDYLCDGSTIQRGTIDRTHKDGLAIVGSDNGQYDHIVITKACQGRYIGHYAGIMLEGSDSVGCENNIVEWCTIEDLDHRQIFNIKEVAYIPSGTNLTNSNIIRNNRCYGAIRGPVRTVGSLSTQSNNGMIEIV